MVPQPRLIVPSIFVSMTAICVLLAIAGVSLIPLVATGMLSWCVVIASRWGVGLGAAASTLGAGLLVLGQMILGAALSIPLLDASVVLWSAVSLMAAVFWTRGYPVRRTMNIRTTLLVWGPPLVGPVIWMVVLLSTVVLPTASRYSWAMAGDSANNILFARQVTYDHGIHLGANENPVPLPAALIALAMSAGRGATDAPDLLRHDIAAFTLVWGTLIALTCYLSGAAAAAAIDRCRTWNVVVVGAGASLIPLSWFVTGYPIEYGFFNAHVALPIVFASWIAANAAAQKPVLALSALLVACTLMLAVWSPLVLVPLALVVAVAVQYRSEILTLRGRQLIVAIVAFAQLGAFGLVGTLPSLLAQGGYLTAVGGFIPFPRTITVVAFAVSALAAGLALLNKRTAPALALAAVVVGGALGIGVLLFLSRGQPSPWTYYPTKLAWLMTVVFCVLTLGTLAGVLPRARSLALGILPVSLVLASFGALYYAAKSIPSYPWRDPIPRILADDFGVNDDVAERIFALSDPEHPYLLWRSGDPHEDSINFWLLQMRANSVKQNTELRVFAYGHGHSVGDLCAIVAAMGGGVTIVSIDPALPAATEKACYGIATVQRNAPG
jgi:hypothetical protein